MLRLFAHLTALAIAWPIWSQQIVLDADFEDWRADDLLLDDQGDANNSLDIQYVYADNDDEFLYLRIDLDDEILLQDQSGLVLLIDSDNNSNTGQNIFGLGAEIQFYFGERVGVHSVANNFSTIFHSDIGLVAAPTHSSRIFELAIKRQIQIDGATVHLSDDIRLKLYVNNANGDLAPNNNTSIVYNIKPNSPTILPEISLKKEDNNIRVLSYNVLFGSLFQPFAEGAYERILTAIEPDIIAFQEIYDQGSSQTLNKVVELTGTQPEDWYHAKEGSDAIVISKYPILYSEFLAGNGAFVLDVDGKEMLLINAHLPCCGNDDGREEEIDAILAYIREMKAGRGGYPLAINSPIIITGDMNLVGKGSQLKSLFTGDIRNNSVYGPDVEMDWDGSDLINQPALVVNRPMTYTWNDEMSSFFPGRLDFVLYTGSSLENTKALILDTRVVDNVFLQENYLSTSDSRIASDHLPLIYDFALRGTTSNNPITTYSDLITTFPNPTNGRIQLDLSKLNSTSFDLQVYNSIGNSVHSKQLQHKYSTFDLSPFPDGPYYLIIKAKNQFILAKVTKITGH
jgi:endonuclease/exonuclease/phosphatase family metal-dependent hydrolase